MKKIILFDLDGTLINAGGAGVRALNKAVSDLCGRDNICNFFELQGSTDKDNFEKAFYYAFKRKPTKKEYEKLKSLYLSYLPEEVEYSIKTKRYFKIKGVERLLKVLKKYEEVLLGLGSGNLEEGAYIKLKPSGLGEYFSFGGFGGEFIKREDMLKSAVKKASLLLNEKILPSSVYVVGDTEKDIIASKNLGYHSAVILDGFGDKEKMIHLGSELIEKDFSNVDIWLIWLGLKKDPKGIKRGSYICPDTPIEHAYYGMTGVGSFEVDKMLEKIRRIRRS